MKTLDEAVDVVLIHVEGDRAEALGVKRLDELVDRYRGVAAEFHSHPKVRAVIACMADWCEDERVLKSVIFTAMLNGVLIGMEMGEAGMTEDPERGPELAEDVLPELWEDSGVAD